MTIYEEEGLMPSGLSVVQNDTGKTEPVILIQERESLICGRCNKPTGNRTQGHFWAWCKVTMSIRKNHFCCPGDCELGRVP